jgi:hypothetical protein
MQWARYPPIFELGSRQMFRNYHFLLIEVQLRGWPILFFMPAPASTAHCQFLDQTFRCLPQGFQSIN